MFSYYHPTSCTAKWKPDESTNSCYCCKGSFTLTIRRHHCRTCGNVVCDRCSVYRELIETKEVRICVSCSTYLKIRRSGDKPQILVEIINECLSQYIETWTQIRALLDGHSRLLNIISKKNKILKNKNLLIPPTNDKNKNNNVINIEDNDYHLIDNGVNENGTIDTHKIKIDLHINNIKESLTLHEIEDRLKSIRKNNMIYFIAIPPRHNPKISVWTRRLLLITSDSRILVTSPLSAEIPLYKFIPKYNPNIKKHPRQSNVYIETQPNINNTNKNKNKNNVNKIGDYNIIDDELENIINIALNSDNEDDEKSVDENIVHKISFQFYSKLVHFERSHIMGIPDQFKHIPQFPQKAKVTNLIFRKFDLLKDSSDNGSKHGAYSAAPSQMKSISSRSTTPKTISRKIDTQGFGSSNNSNNITNSKNKQTKDSNNKVNENIIDDDEIDLEDTHKINEEKDNKNNDITTYETVKSYIGSFWDSSKPPIDNSSNKLTKNSKLQSSNNNSFTQSKTANVKPRIPVYRLIILPFAVQFHPKRQIPYIAGSHPKLSLSLPPPPKPPNTLIKTRKRSDEMGKLILRRDSQEKPPPQNVKRKLSPVGVERIKKKTSNETNSSNNTSSDSFEFPNIDNNELKEEKNQSQNITAQDLLDFDQLFKSSDKNNSNSNNKISKSKLPKSPPPKPSKSPPKLANSNVYKNGNKNKNNNNNTNNVSDVSRSLSFWDRLFTEKDKSKRGANYKAKSHTVVISPSPNDKKTSNNNNSWKTILSSMVSSVATQVGGGSSGSSPDKNDLPRINSEITSHPQYNMFPLEDWKSLDIVGYDSNVDIIEVLDTHRILFEDNHIKHITQFFIIDEKMKTNVSWNNKNHIKKLEIIWNSFQYNKKYIEKGFPGKPDESWKEIGFQGKDPITDFRGMGEYALDCLSYFAKEYNSYCQIIFGKKRDDKYYYPICASFINIVNLISELLDCRRILNKSLNKQTVLFKLFVYESINNKPFKEMFCVLIRVFDNIWRATKSTYFDFPLLYSAFRQRIEFLLKKDPISLKILLDWIECDSLLFEYKSNNDINQMDIVNQNITLFAN